MRLSILETRYMYLHFARDPVDERKGKMNINLTIQIEADAVVSKILDFFLHKTGKFEIGEHRPLSASAFCDLPTEILHDDYKESRSPKFTSSAENEKKYKV